VAADRDDLRSMMNLEWEQRRESSHIAAVLIGATLGAALGADCFLAARQLVGAPAVLCGGALAFFAVKGGSLFADRNSRAGALLALLPVILWGCLANHLSFALAAAPGGPAVIWISPELKYWLQLAGLLGTALAAWIGLFLLVRREQELVKRAARPCRRTFDPPPVDMEMFFPKHEWIRPFHLQRRITQGLWLAAFFTCGWMKELVGGGPVWSRSMGAMLFGLLIIVPFFTLFRRICSAEHILFVRRGDRLWRVDMRRIVDLELGVPLSRLARMWDRLPQARRSSFKSAVAAVTAQTNIAFFEFIHPQLMAQSRWEWAVSCTGGSSVYIPKVYPNFSPVPRDAEPLRKRPPLRWCCTVCTLLVTVVCLAAGYFIGWVDQNHQSFIPGPPTESILPEPDASDPVTAALTPEKIGWYYLNGLTLLTDDAFQAATTEFWDQENDLYYHIALRYGVGEEAALYELERPGGEHPRYLRPDSGNFLWGMGENGVVYRYNLRSAALPDGQTGHIGVALSERGTLIMIDCTHGGDVEEETVRGTLLYMLENLQFTGPAITEENYQEQLRPAVSMGFNYCGQAFFKAPPGMLGYDAFIDTFLPCGGKVNYYDGGISMMTEAHGLRVSAAVVPNEGTAMDVVEQAYQDLKEAGRQYDEQNLFQDAYNEEGNNACRVTVYYDGGRTRVTVLAAMEESDGYYLFKELTCLPEEIDGEYQAVFKEMEAACGIEVPVMETLGRFSG